LFVISIDGPRQDFIPHSEFRIPKSEIRHRRRLNE